MSKTILGVIGVAINTLLLPLGQYFWKISLADGYSFRIFFSKYFIIGASCYVLGTVFWLFALSVFPLSKIYPFVSLSYIFGALIGFLFLKEPFSMVNVAGYLLLLVALVLIATKAA